MKKKVICALMCLGLCLPMAQAALLPAVNAYPGFADVGEGDWFYANAKLCSEVGLMNGTGNGFEPQKLLTVAECAAVASRIREALTGEAIPANTSGPWYQNYLDYMAAADPSLGAILASPEAPSTRMQYLLLLGAALPQDGALLSAINSITTLPDTDNSVVLSFYNAGVLTGVDDYGTFDGNKSLSRAECAAMVSRVIQPELRVSFTPKAHDHQSSHGDDGGETHDHLPAEGGSQSAPATGSQNTVAVNGRNVMSVNGRMVDYTLFVNILNSVVYDQDVYLRQQTGHGLDWDASYSVGDLDLYFWNQAIREAIFYSVLSAKAEELGCANSEVPAKLFPNPDHAALSAFARQSDLLCAKHILVDSPDTANAVINGLDAAPTLDQFNALLAVFGTDPGMTQNPNGYLFSSGEMVSEFEAGTRALDIGSYSPQPVQSTYGYHIIWRLDPTTHPDLLSQYQNTMAVEQLSALAEAAQVELNEPLIRTIDPRACYETFLGG